MPNNNEKQLNFLLRINEKEEFTGNCSVVIIDRNTQQFGRFSSINELGAFIKKYLMEMSSKMDKEAEQREQDEKLDKMIDDMDRDGVMLCPFLDQKENLCSDYKYEWKGYRGGVCICYSICQGCNGKGKVWNDELGVPTKTRFRQCKNCKESIFKYLAGKGGK